MTGGESAAVLAATTKEATCKTEADRRKAPLGILDSVEDLITRYRGNADAIKAGIYAAVIGAVGIAAALSCIPFSSNFGTVFAGQMLHTLSSPGVSKAINAPLSDYLDNIFPTNELNVRMLVTGLENGALTDEELVDTAVDSGLKDKEIKKLLKIAKVARFTKETKEDYAMLDRYQDAWINAQITNARDEIDAAVKERQALWTQYKKLAEQEAMKEMAT